MVTSKVTKQVIYLYTDPVIISLTSSPSSSVMVGDSITLTCSVVLPDGVTGTPVTQWMGPAGGVQSVSSVLTLSEIAPSQAGLYTCTATLANIVLNTTSITVIVQSKCLELCIYLHFYVTTKLSLKFQ